MPASVDARELGERVMERGGPDLAALEDVAGDHERMRAALDRERADAREGLALGGADARPDARVEARAGGVEVAVRRVDDPQHGCRSLEGRSAVTTSRRPAPRGAPEPCGARRSAIRQGGSGGA